jgi:hypothetical protein
MSIRTLTRVASLAVGFGLCPSLFAVSFSWSFTGATSQGTVGNSFSFTPDTGGPSIKATAWYLDASNVFKQAALGIYANGLGVCYPGENCTNPNNQLDNSVFREFIMLESSTLIDPLSVRIKTSGDTATGSPSDTDVTYWLGSGVGQNLNLTGNTVANLASLGFGARTNNNANADLCNGCSRDVALTPTSTGVTKLIFGAAYTGGSDDYFALSSMIADPVAASSSFANPVPEPSSLVLLATIGLACVHLAKRSRRLPS